MSVRTTQKEFKVNVLRGFVAVQIMVFEVVDNDDEAYSTSYQLTPDMARQLAYELGQIAVLADEASDQNAEDEE